MAVRRVITACLLVASVLAFALPDSHVAYGQTSVTEVTSPDARDFNLFGISVALDGTRLVVGALGGGPDSTGAAYVFLLNDGVWIQSAVLLPPDGQRFDDFGSSVAIDGNVIVVGAPRVDAGPNVQDVGAVYIFEESAPETWTFVEKLVPPNPEFLLSYGKSVAVDGNFVAIGAPSNIESSSPGEAYIYERTGTGTIETLIPSPDGANGDNFGVSVALQEQGTTLVVGADRNDEVGADAGAAYVFERSGSAWSLDQKLTASDGERSDRFGLSVSMHNGTIAIGSPLTEVPNTQFLDTGSVYLFSRNSSDTWEETSLINMGFPSTSYAFGASTSLSGDRVVGGAPGGSIASFFEQVAPDSFTETSVFHPREGDGNFGTSVSLYGSLLAVGAPTESTNFSTVGTVFVYSLPNRPPTLGVVPPQTLNEGQTSQVIVTATDLDGDGTTLSTGSLPSFATFVDNQDRTGSLTLSPTFNDAGAYNITIVATDDLSLQTSIRNISVTVTDVAQLSPPVIGEAILREPLSVRINIADPQQSTAETLFFRPSGTAAFRETPFLPTTGNEFEAEIPDSLVTELGLDLFVSVTFDQNVVTFPADGPSDPEHVRVTIPSLKADAIISARQYRMLSVPYELTDSEPGRMLQDDLGELSPDNWRLFRWVPETEVYAEYPETVSGFDIGAAFWLVTGRSDSVDFGNGVSTSVVDPQTVRFAPGWNQIGNPYGFAVAWNTIDPDGLLRDPVFFDGVDYQFNQPVLEPWDGYFVFNEGEVVSLIVPPIAAVLTDPQVPSQSPGYSVQVLASSVNATDKHNFVGIAETALDGLDDLDILEPPPIYSSLHLDIVNEGYRMASDFKPASDGGAYWDFVIRPKSSSDDEPVSIQFIEHGARVDGLLPYLVDSDGGPPILIEGDRADFTYRGTGNKTFRIVLGTPQFATQQAELAALLNESNELTTVYPNPFGNRTTIVYTLIETTPVRLQVFNVLGQLVVTLVDNTVEAGVHRVQFEATGNSGADLSSGVYFVRLQGNGFTSSRTLVIDQ